MGQSTPLNCTVFCGNYKGNRGHNPTLMEVLNLMGGLEKQINTGNGNTISDSNPNMSKRNTS